MIKKDSRNNVNNIGNNNGVRLCGGSADNKCALPSVGVSCVPLALLILALIVVVAVSGASTVQEHAPMILLLAAVAGVTVSLIATPQRSPLLIAKGVVRSARQVLPAVPILLLIGSLSATWMLSGVVPGMIDLGVKLMHPQWFLPMTCAMCAVVSIITGSSWTTIATLGVGFMGIGSVLGYSPGWMAGAIISGAYFGEKVSPLSDTTVLAASSCGVPLMRHISNLMWTSLPALCVALVVFGVASYNHTVVDGAQSREMVDALRVTFNMSPWLMAIPALTAVLIVLRVPTVWVLAAGSVAGLAGMLVIQPQIVDALGGSDLMVALQAMFTGTELSTGNELLDSLVATGGMMGMFPTIMLVLSAMVFGGVLIGTGMLESITSKVTGRLRSPRSLVSATCGSGLFFNSVTGDQYLSIIIGGNVFREAYEDNHVCPTALSRTLEDSVSVTSVLIPWNSCGVTQSTVLGVATLSYLPYCVFNLCSPVMTLLLAFAGWKIKSLRREGSCRLADVPVPVASN